jgi:hypothetical protein
MGVAMVVGGLAFLFSGLIFLIPVRRNGSESEGPFGDRREQVERHLSDVRRTRGEIDD